MTDLTNNSGPTYDTGGQLRVTGAAGTVAQNLALATNVSATGAQAALTWSGGKGLFAVVGTLAGCTVNLEYQGPNSQWITLASIASVGSPVSVDPIPSSASVRANLVGGAPANVYVQLAS